MATVDVFGRRIDAPQEVDFQKDVLAFGRPGYGAPLRTKSGRPVTFLKQDPVIRYNSNCNSNAENAFLERYEKRIRELKQQNSNEAVPRSLPALEPPHTPRPMTSDSEAYAFNTGGGITAAETNGERHHQLRRGSSNEDLNGNDERGIRTPVSPTKETYQNGLTPRPTQGFVVHRPDLKEKLGWVNSASPSLIGIAKYRESLREQLQRMAERKKREELEYKDASGTELVTVLCQKVVGKPKRDPITGDIVDHHLGTTDITSDWRRPTKTATYESQGYEFLKQDPAAYRRFLAEQTQARVAEENRHKAMEREIFNEHCRTWSSFWGRPGYGAPRTGSTHKGNLFAMLHDVRYYRKPQTMPQPPRTAPNPTRQVGPLQPLVGGLRTPPRTAP